MEKILVSALLVFAASFAHAADAGKIIFVAGAAKVGDQTAREGAPVQEGEMLSTGADGFIYVKTVDDGLFILRPQTRARIVSYHIDHANPANTRIKLELLSGVARSKSGDAVKEARQNFRFNTPVAAIGVRGTDFTVFTDNETSRVAVISGGVVVSGFGGGCLPDGGGPCEGATSRELTAAQRGQLVQVKRGQSAPQLLESSPLSPDLVSPPRQDEPLSKAGNVNGPASAPTSTSLEANKNASLIAVIGKATPPAPPVQPGNPGQVPAPIPEAPPLPDSSFLWGRWQQIEGKAPQFDLVNQPEKTQLLRVNGNFALFRTEGQEYVAPNSGSVGFTLRGNEAYVYTDYGYGHRTVSPATLSNGSLTVDFGSRTFATKMDLTSQGEVTQLRGEGAVTKDGRLFGDANGRFGYINVQGLLSKERGDSAAYIFDGRLDSKRTVNGGATWR